MSNARDAVAVSIGMQKIHVFIAMKGSIKKLIITIWIKTPFKIAKPVVLDTLPP